MTYASQYVGYPSSPYTLRPYTEPEILAHQGPERARRYAFNKNLSGIRVYVEHTIGLLKGRFPSMKDMGRHEDPQDIYKAIHAMLVLHNLCIDLGDAEDQFIGEGMEDDDEAVLPDHGGDIVIEPGNEGHIPAYETDDWHKEAGRNKRERILDDLFPLHDYQ